MDIVYSSNEQYARHLAVSMYSLMDRNQAAEKIRVFILSSGISQESKEQLLSIGQQFGREIVWISMGDLREGYPYAVDTGGFDISAMGRLFVGTVLPDEVERVLYLDCDTVVLDSLRRLWETDLKGKLFGAVMEPTIYRQVKERIGLGEKDPYFNSGVLLIDVKRWRQEGAEQELLDFFGALGGKTFACDQDTLNGAFRGRIRPLHPRYNFFSNYRYFHYEDLKRQSPAYGAVSRAMFMQAKRHPAVIHFAGDERPWKAGNLCHYRRAYEHYLGLTPWKGTAKEKGQRLYLLAYHGMDYLTFVCPPARQLISSRFGMQVVENRKRDGRPEEKEIPREKAVPIQEQEENGQG